MGLVIFANLFLVTVTESDSAWINVCVFGRSSFSLHVLSIKGKVDVVLNHPECCVHPRVNHAEEVISNRIKSVHDFHNGIHSDSRKSCGWCRRNAFHVDPTREEIHKKWTGTCPQCLWQISQCMF